MPADGQGVVSVSSIKRAASFGCSEHLSIGLLFVCAQRCGAERDQQFDVPDLLL